jgi:hypothetical protein
VCYMLRQDQVNQPPCLPDFLVQTCAPKGIVLTELQVKGWCTSHISEGDPGAAGMPPPKHCDTAPSGHWEQARQVSGHCTALGACLGPGGFIPAITEMHHWQAALGLRHICFCRWSDGQRSVGCLV